MPSADARPRRRADAVLNIARIVSAARRSLSADPEATVEDIARAAGLGRMTVYGHFPNRAALVEAALVDALRAGEETLSALDLGGDARHALARLLDSSWSLVAESAALLAAAQDVLPAGRILELHADAAARVEEVLRRGQHQGVFRTDLPITWLVSVVHHVLNAAADEVDTGRMTTDDVTRTVVATVQPMLESPHRSGVQVDQAHPA